MKTKDKNEEWNEQEKTIWSKFPEHNTDSPEYWCDPEIEIYDGTKLIIHRGFN